MAERLPESEQSDSGVMVERCPAADIEPGDVIWADECGDFVEVRLVKQDWPTAPIFFTVSHTTGEGEIEHEFTNVVLRKHEKRKRSNG